MQKSVVFDIDSQNNKSNGQISLQLGTATNVLSEKTFSHRDHAIYLTNPPYDNRKPLIDNFIVLYFLRTFKKNKYSSVYKWPRSQLSGHGVRLIQKVYIRF